MMYTYMYINIYIYILCAIALLISQITHQSLQEADVAMAARSTACTVNQLMTSIEIKTSEMQLMLEVSMKNTMC